MNDELFTRLGAVAEAYGLEVSAFIRMMILQHIREYELNAASFRGDDPPPQP